MPSDSIIVLDWYSNLTSEREKNLFHWQYDLLTTRRGSILFWGPPRTHRLFRRRTDGSRDRVTRLTGTGTDQMTSWRYPWRQLRFRSVSSAQLNAAPPHANWFDLTHSRRVNHVPANDCASSAFGAIRRVMSGGPPASEFLHPEPGADSPNRTWLIRQTGPTSSGITSKSRYNLSDQNLPSLASRLPLHSLYQHFAWLPTWPADQPAHLASVRLPGGPVRPCPGHPLDPPRSADPAPTYPRPPWTTEYATNPRICLVNFLWRRKIISDLDLTMSYSEPDWGSVRQVIALGTDGVNVPQVYV